MLLRWSSWFRGNRGSSMEEQMIHEAEMRIRREQHAEARSLWRPEQPTCGCCGAGMIMQDIFICQWCRGSSSVCVHMMGSCCARDYTFTSQAQCDRFGSQEEMDEYFADPANAQELEETCITLTLCPCHNDVLRYMGVPIQKPIVGDAVR